MERGFQVQEEPSPKSQARANEEGRGLEGKAGRQAKLEHPRARAEIREKGST